MSTQDLNELTKIAYEAHALHRHKAHGENLPKFEALPGHAVGAWRATAQAVADATKPKSPPAKVDTKTEAEDKPAKPTSK